MIATDQFHLPPPVVLRLPWLNRPLPECLGRAGLRSWPNDLQFEARGLRYGQDPITYQAYWLAEPRGAYAALSAAARAASYSDLDAASLLEPPRV